MIDDPLLAPALPEGGAHPSSREPGGFAARKERMLDDSNSAPLAQAGVLRHP